MSVIISRALPDVRDGLKPVQRRTLYDMYELGIRYDRPYRKCARIVGDTMGKYHPHGDSSIYEALVVMAQDFKKGKTLVDGHGNFGSIEGDGAAAMRYTEARLEKLTQSLLTLDKLDSKGRPLHMNDFDINRTIKNTVATFEGICRKKMITIELHLESETLMVHADMEQIQQVLYNLIDNAIKFSSDSSIIKAETSERHGTVFVSIKDSGVGIPREKQNKIWDRFYKIDSSRGKDRKGTGLGLSIVREIVAAHNQNINVISTEGVGTEFIFTLEKSRGTS